LAHKQTVQHKQILEKWQYEQDS